jgi:hypothetical protein
MQPITFVGIDLTDSYPTTSRPVDVAILNAQTGTIEFRDFRWPDRGSKVWPTAVAKAILPFRTEDTVFVVDGPQALAKPGSTTRAAERCLRTPAHTAWKIPAPRSMPFAGYISTSIDFFNALVQSGFRLAELAEADPMLGTLFEAYPGAVWPRLYQGQVPLHSKATREGRDQRTEILKILGCRFVQPGPLTHDQLDAAVCAVLGWRFFYSSVACPVTLIGDIPVYRDANKVLREGRMLAPAVQPRKLPRIAKPLIEPLPSGDTEAELQKCNWVYFAGSARAVSTDTYELADSEGIIARKAFSTAGRPIANVQRIQPGDKILLAYGKGTYRALCSCKIDTPDSPVRHGSYQLPAISAADPVLSRKLRQAGYKDDIDPVLGIYTVIPIREVTDLQDVMCEFQRPSQNTIQEWDRVFPNG